MNTPQVSIGDVLTRTIQLYGKHLGLLIGMGAVLFVPSGLLQALGNQAGIFGSLLGSVVAAVATAVFTGAVVRVVQAEDAGHDPGSIGEIFSSVGDRIWPLIWVGIIAGLATALGLVLLVVPGLILMTIWAVYQPVIVVEGVSIDSLSRSRELVKGNGWNVFGLIVVVFLLSLAISIVAGALGAGLGGLVGIVIISIILSILLLPIAGLIHAVLYFTLAGHDAPQATQPPPPAPPAVPQV